MNLFRHKQESLDCYMLSYMCSDQMWIGIFHAALMKVGYSETIITIVIAKFLRVRYVLYHVIIVILLFILSVWEEIFAKFAEFPYTTYVLKCTLEQKRQEKYYSSNMHIVMVNCKSAWQMKKKLLAYDADMSIEDVWHKLEKRKVLRHLEKSPRAPPLF